MRVDIAAPDIIDHTDPEWQDYVRLYFRPRTPTQYRNEGFRPASEVELGAHCPVPVYLLFDSYKTLSRQDSLFTEGNLATGTEPMRTIDDLSRMPFELIYHDTWFGPQEGSSIIFHRNAEVLIPRRLGLRNVRRVLCRSQAEHETLLNLLPLPVRNRWADRIGVSPSAKLFHARWSFVEQVELTDQYVQFRFNKATTTPGPFAARAVLSVRSATGSLRYPWSKDKFKAGDMLRLGLGGIGNPTDYSVSLYLDDHLAFEGRYEAYDLPW